MTTPNEPDAYIVRVGGAQVGPVTLDQLRRGMQAGKIPEHAEAMPVGGGDWKPVAVVALRFALPPPRLPPNPRLPDPSWSDFRMGEISASGSAPALSSTPGPAPPVASSDDPVAAATKTFGRPWFLVFVPGSQEPPAGPFTATVLKARMESGKSPPNALVCVVDEHACWVPIKRLFDE